MNVCAIQETTNTALHEMWEREEPALRAELAQAKARVQSLLMRHNANHGDGGSITCEDCIEARAILAARQKEESRG